MRDKLTKKRIKVDYQLVIRVLGLDLEFTEYIFRKRTSISERRLAYAFLISHVGKDKLEDTWNSCLARGLNTFEDWQKMQSDIASFNIWED